MTGKILEYAIVVREGKDGPLRERHVLGYPTHMPIPGTFATRHCDPDEGDFWILDHIESGCRVTTAASQGGVIDSALRMLRTKGVEGFQAAFAEAAEKRATYGLPVAQEMEQAA